MAAKALEGHWQSPRLAWVWLYRIQIKPCQGRQLKSRVLAGPRDRVGVGWGLQFLSSRHLCALITIISISSSQTSSLEPAVFNQKVLGMMINMHGNFLCHHLLHLVV